MFIDYTKNVYNIIKIFKILKIKIIYAIELILCTNFQCLKSKVTYFRKINKFINRNITISYCFNSINNYQ